MRSGYSLILPMRDRWAASGLTIHAYLADGGVDGEGMVDRKDLLYTDQQSLLLGGSLHFLQSDSSLHARRGQLAMSTLGSVDNV